MSAVETGQMTAVEIGQMAAVETGQMSAVETRQMFKLQIGGRASQPKTTNLIRNGSRIDGLA